MSSYQRQYLQSLSNECKLTISFAENSYVKGLVSKMATLKEYRIELGWTVTRLAEESGISRPTINAAERGSTIQADVAKAIVDALSRGYGRDIKIRDVDGLN